MADSLRRRATQALDQGQPPAAGLSLWPLSGPSSGGAQFTEVCFFRGWLGRRAGVVGSTGLEGREAQAASLVSGYWLAGRPAFLCRNLLHHCGRGKGRGWGRGSAQPWRPSWWGRGLTHGLQVPWHQGSLVGPASWDMLGSEHLLTRALEGSATVATRYRPGCPGNLSVGSPAPWPHAPPFPPPSQPCTPPSPASLQAFLGMVCESRLLLPLAPSGKGPAASSLSWPQLLAAGGLHALDSPSVPSSRGEKQSYSLGLRGQLCAHTHWAARSHAGSPRSGRGPECPLGGSLALPHAQLSSEASLGPSPQCPCQGSEDHSHLGHSFFFICKEREPDDSEVHCYRDHPGYPEVSGQGLWGSPGVPTPHNCWEASTSGFSWQWASLAVARGGLRALQGQQRLTRRSQGSRDRSQRGSQAQERTWWGSQAGRCCCRTLIRTTKSTSPARGPPTAASTVPPARESPKVASGSSRKLSSR